MISAVLPAAVETVQHQVPNDAGARGKGGLQRDAVWAGDLSRIAPPALRDRVAAGAGQGPRVAQAPRPGTVEKATTVSGTVLPRRALHQARKRAGQDGPTIMRVTT